jgi:hypothetical protein
MTDKPKATAEQLEIAKQHRIPFSQAHTINVAKAMEYKKYLASQKGRDEQFLKSLETKCE